MNQMQEAARKLHALGFKTLPIRPGSKEPAYVPGVFEHGVKDATIDDAVTDAHYEAHPDHGIGVSGDGFVIFDFDIHDGVDGRDAMLGWKLPDTLAQTTPSGGYHLFYRADGDIPPSVNTQIAVDVRAHNSYVVCDPTPGYCFEEDCDIAQANRAVMAFLDYVRPTEMKPEKPKRGPGRPPKTEVVLEGGRNDYLFRKGRSLRSDASNSDEVIRAHLYGLNHVNCKPPLGDAEIEKLIESVLSVPAGLSEEAKKQQQSRRSRKFDHASIAEELIDDCGFCLVDGMPVIRSEHAYTPGWDAVNREIIARERSCTIANRKEVQSYLTVTAERKEQSAPNLIAFNNGVLDVTTLELRPWQDDDVIPNVIPHAWNPSASCDDVDAVLLKMAADDLDVWNNLMEVMGVCMYRSAEFGQSAVLLGSGSNGKSTYIQMLQALLGEQNIASLDISQLGTKFDICELAGKLANLGDDISNEFQRGDLLSRFKKIVTGNRLKAEVKYGIGFNFTPYCQMVFSANEFPRLADYSDGMMRRLFPIEFNAVFKRTDPDYNPRIRDIITTEQACERMAYLGVIALQGVIERNGFTPNAASSRRVEEIKADNDTVYAWLLDTGFDASTIGEIPISVHYEHYRSWALDSGLQPVKRTKFTRSVNTKLGTDSLQKKVSGKPVRFFLKAEK